MLNPNAKPYQPSPLPPPPLQTLNPNPYSLTLKPFSFFFPKTKLNPDAKPYKYQHFMPNLYYLAPTSLNFKKRLSLLPHPLQLCRRPIMAECKKTTTASSITSVMMKNIPTSISREMLMEIVDQHCKEENTKALTMSSHQDTTTLSEYDCLFLPMDFGKRENLGYAFLNFTTSVGAVRFHKSFDNLSWKEYSTFIDSPEICKIFPSRVQGKDAIMHLQEVIYHDALQLKHFSFKCDTDEYFSPPQNGSTSPALIGKRQKWWSLASRMMGCVCRSISGCFGVLIW